MVNSQSKGQLKRYDAARHASKVIQSLLDHEAYHATKFLSPSLIVRATGPKKWDKRDAAIHLTVTIGVPNCTEKEFIKDCQKAGEPFPVKGIILKFAPKPRLKKKK